MGYSIITNHLDVREESTSPSNFAKINLGNMGLYEGTIPVGSPKSISYDKKPHQVEWRDLIKIVEESHPNVAADGITANAFFPLGKGIEGYLVQFYYVPPD